MSGVKDDLAKMEARLKKLEEHPETRVDSDTPDRRLQVIVTGWAEETAESEITSEINQFLQHNGLKGNARDVFCFTDPSIFGVIEFVSVAGARSFLRGLRKATRFNIEGERNLRFSPNHTLAQRAQDKRLGKIKHRLSEEGHDLSDIKIVWKRQA